MFLKSCPKSSYESIKASPSLPERAGARRRRVWVAEKRAELSMDFGFSELVEIPEEFQDMGSTAAGEGERWTVVAEVLAKSVPITAFLVLIAAESGRRSGGGGRGGGGGGVGCGGRIGVSGGDQSSGNSKVCREIWGQSMGI